MDDYKGSGAAVGPGPKGTQLWHADEGLDWLLRPCGDMALDDLSEDDIYARRQYWAQVQEVENGEVTTIVETAIKNFLSII